MKKSLFIMIASITFSYSQIALAERLISHICWMGNVCTKEYLISLIRHENDQVTVRVKGVNEDNGKVNRRFTQYHISCKVPGGYIDTIPGGHPSPEPQKPNHYSAAGHKLWLAVCRGQYGKPDEW